MKLLLRSLGLGIVGYLIPRFLAALGVPFDQWVTQLASAIKGIPTIITLDTTITVLGMLIGFGLMFIELWWKPVGHFISRIGGWRSTKKELNKLFEADNKDSSSSDMVVSPPMIR